MVLEFFNHLEESKVRALPQYKNSKTGLYFL